MSRSKSILIFNRGKLSAVPFCAWLGPDVEAVLLSDASVAAGQADLAEFREAVLVEDYTGNPIVELQADELHRRHGFEAVVSLSERDVLRAARFRERHGIAGQWSEGAVAFRDKVVMKQRLVAAGVPVARFRPVACAADLWAFADEHGFPMVVKPRREVSSEGVVVVSSVEKLTAYISSSSTLRGDYDSNLMVEEYVEHELYLVDGLAVDGKLSWCWASWMSSMLDHHAAKPLISHILDPQDPLIAELRALTEKALAALPPLELSIIHAEVFRTPDGRLVFNEIASRIGGAKIDSMLAHAFGVGLVESYLGALAGRTVAPAERPQLMTGFAMFRPRSGTLERIPAACPLPGVLSYEPLAVAGARLAKPVNGVTSIGSLVLEGEHASDVRRKLDDAVGWFESSTVIIVQDQG